jgi:hypothetical protein
MSKLIVAFLSFACGLLAAFLVLAGTHNLPVTHAQQGIKVMGMEPVVPPLPSIATMNSDIEIPLQPLDGLNCNNCTISSQVITYGGGPFSVPNCTIKTTQWKMKGAALNTYILLTALGVIHPPTPAPRGKAIPPTMEAGTIEIVPPQNKVDLVSY